MLLAALSVGIVSVPHSLNKGAAVCELLKETMSNHATRLQARGNKGSEMDQFPSPSGDA